MNQSIMHFNVQLSDLFIKWLQETPWVLAQLYEITKAWLEYSGKPVSLPSATGAEGPRQWKANTPLQINLEPITNEQIDALYKAKADAVVKEKAIAFIKGALFGISLVSGVSNPIGSVVGTIGSVVGNAISATTGTNSVSTTVNNNI